MKFLLNFLFLALLAAPAAAQTQVITYDLQSVMLKPDVTHPGASAQPMTGQFTWTYTVGDYENGIGEMIWVDIPWFGSDLAEMNITIELSSMEFTLNGNINNLGLDVSLKFQSDLSPFQPALIDTAQSSFDIERFNSIHKGHLVNGQIAPLRALSLIISGTCPTTLQADVTGATTNGQVALLYSFGTGSFTIPNGYPCAGTVLGLDQTVTLGTMLTADANGSAQFPFNVPSSACGMVYLQALNLETCHVSRVHLLQ